jgi:hypothetical protein
MLLAVTASTSFIDWAPTRFLPETGIWRWLKMPTWLDEQYMWMGVMTLIGFAWIMYRFGFVPEELSDGGAAAQKALVAGARGETAAEGKAASLASAEKPASDSTSMSPKAPGSKQRGPGGKRKGRAKK